ncbi:MAG: tail fiber domain-containing protein, partial [Candidatus Peregrinibacteria bacterium]|nr:tail fiber domain-containing protein [Candidatus Peregrinibacteria bacterium]
PLLNIGSSTQISGILDQDDMSSDSNVSLCTQQSIKAYVDNYSSRYTKVITIGPTNCMYTGIQAAITANGNANTLFLVFPGNYPNDTITFNAINQHVKGIGEVYVTQDTAQIITGAYADCIIENINITTTFTDQTRSVNCTALTTFQNCKFTTTNSGTFTAGCTIFNIGTSAVLSINECEINSTINSTHNGWQLIFGLGNVGTLNIRDSNINFYITNATTSADYNVILLGTTSSGSIEIRDTRILISTTNENKCNIIYAPVGTDTTSMVIERNNFSVLCPAGTSHCCIYQIANQTALTITSSYNSCRVTSSAGYSKFIRSLGTGITMTSKFDNIDVLDANGTISGTYTNHNSPSVGTLDVSTNITTPAININSTVDVVGVLDEDDMSSNSATNLCTQQSIKEYSSIGLSAGVISGFGITDNLDGTVSIAAGTCLLRNANSDSAPINVYSVSGDNFSISLNNNTYIYIDYNSGSPILKQTTTLQETIKSNENDLIDLYEIDRNGTTILHICEHLQLTNNVTRQIQKYLYACNSCRRTSGLLVSNTGTLNLAMTSGEMWTKLNLHTIPAIDTSASGTFSSFYDDGAGGHTELTSQTDWDNLRYDGGAGSLVTLNASKYGFHDIYVESDGKLVLIYGRAEYVSLSTARQASLISDLPLYRLGLNSVFIGRIVFQKSAATFTFYSAFTETLQVSGVTDHGNLSGLTDDDHTQYFNSTRINDGTCLGIKVNGTIFNDDYQNYTANTDMSINANNSTSDSTLTLYNSDATYKCNVEVEGILLSDTIRPYTSNGDITIDVLDTGAHSILNILNSNGSYTANLQVEGQVLASNLASSTGCYADTFGNYTTNNYISLIANNSTQNGYVFVTNEDVTYDADLKIDGGLYVDTITEYSTNNGVTIESINLQDSKIYPTSGAAPYITGNSTSMSHNVASAEGFIDFTVNSNQNLMVDSAGLHLCSLELTTSSNDNTFTFPDASGDGTFNIVGDDATQYYTCGNSGNWFPCSYGDSASSGLQMYMAPNGLIGTNTSTRNTKKFIKNFSTDRLYNLKPRTFQYRKIKRINGERIYQDEVYPDIEYGLIYDEVEGVMPELLAKSKDGKPLTVSYHKLTPMLLQCVQEQKKEIEELREMLVAPKFDTLQLITSLRKDIQLLQKRLAILEN